MDEAEVAVLDEVEQREARRLVPLRDAYDEPEVGLHEAPPGVVAALYDSLEFAAARCGEPRILRLKVLSGLRSRFDCLGEACLVVFGQERVLADVVEVEPDEVLLAPFCTHVRHGSSAFDSISRSLGASG